MADLVERLRKLSDDCMEDGYEDQGIGLHDAADELDRLRAENASLRESVSAKDLLIASLTKENENLKAYAKHERSLGAEPWMLQCNDLTQQLAAAKAEYAEYKEIGSKLSDDYLKLHADFNVSQSQLAATQQKLAVAKGALEKYADESEWQSASEGSPWLFYYLASTCDGNGYELAKQTLRKIS